MKKTLMAIFCGILLLMLCACGAQEEFTEVSNSTVPAVPQTIEATEATGAPVEEIAEPKETLNREILKMEEFSEDRAWIKYKENDTEYWAVVDKNGNVLSRMKEHSNMIHTPFSNGYAHIYDNATEMAYIIDVNGQITYQISEEYVEGGPQVVLKDSGLIVTCKETSDFYGEGYEYTILNGNGSTIEQFTGENEFSVVSCGKGVIYFRGKGYFCAESKAWVSDNVTENHISDTPNFTDSSANAAVIGVEDNGNAELVILYTDGTTSKVTTELRYHTLRGAKFYPIDGEYVYARKDSMVVSINTKTGAVYELEDTYAEKVEEDYPVVCDEDRIIVTLEGADDNDYNFVFDEKMNKVCGPVDYWGYNSIADSRIIGFNNAYEHTVYDKDGNVLFSLADMGYGNWVTSFVNIDLKYASGVLLAYDQNHQPVYLNTNGGLLFDKLNFDNTVTISF